jgi:hypothetical protein
MKVLAILVCMATSCGWAAGECREKPEVQMDERAAQSHIVSSRNPELPPGRARLLDEDRVVVVVIVDRAGAICDARAVRGPWDLRDLAVQAVKQHWKFRPFLVNWKPVVAQFPVTVRFVRLKPEPPLRAEFSGPGLRAEPRQAETHCCGSPT